jgi:hypothetical protein
VNAETGTERSTVSDPSGSFSVTALPPGEYVVRVAREGFADFETRVLLLLNQQVPIEIRLSPGGQREQVSVSAQAEIVRSDSPALGTVIDNRAIRQLPLDGRNFYELSLLAPGTVPAARGSAGSVRGDFSIHVNGAREDANNFMLDGIYNGDPKLNGVGVTPPLDAIREFEILTHTYDASFGRNAGGQINVVLRSGSNAFHGTAWEFFRNAKLDARNAFAPADEPAPRYQRNQFGFTFGGPVRPNRTFFFGDYEGTRRREGRTAIANVPTAAERAGDFTASARPPVNLLTGQPLLQLPPAFQHPVGRALVNLYPLPNRAVPGQNFISSPVERDGANHFDARLDHSFASTSDLAVRYSCADRTLFEPFAGAAFSRVPGFGNDVARRAQNVMATETHAFGPSLINELRLGFNRVAMGVSQQDSSVNLNREIGLPETASNPRALGLSFISMTGYSPLGHEYNSPQHGVTNTYQIVDQATYSIGGHSVKFGGDFRVLQQNAFRDVQDRGLLNFIGITGSSVADALLGIPTVTGDAYVDNHQNLRSESIGVFVHDTYRIAPALTLSAGLRYEFTSPGVDIRDRSSIYDPGTGQLVQIGTNGVPRSGYRSDRNNFAPRIGIAWSPDGGSTVVRTAYGIFYDQSALAPSEFLYFSPPYWDFRLYVPLGQSLLSLSDPFPANYPIRLPSSALAIQRDLRTPYNQHWNFNIQRAVGGSAVAEIAYVGTRGVGLISARDINQPLPSPAERYLRPNPFFEDIMIIESRANSTYHALQARYRKRLAAGLTALASYTFGKSIDDASGFFSSATDPNFPQNSYDMRAERGRSSFDVRHRFSLSYTYDLPLRGHAWLTGWQTNGVWTLQSGRPFTVALLPEIDNSNTGRASLGFGANDRPNLVRDPSLGERSRTRWFDTGAFAMPPRGTFGSAGRNILEGPRLATIDVSLVKNTALSEQLTLQLRVEAFNLLNRANYLEPDNYFGSPSFGSVLAAGQPRRLQLGVKFLF